MPLVIANEKLEIARDVVVQINIQMYVNEKPQKLKLTLMESSCTTNNESHLISENCFFFLENCFFFKTLISFDGHFVYELVGLIHFSDESGRIVLKV